MGSIRFSPLLLLCLLVAGCGGGASGGVSGSTEDQTGSQVGPLAITYKGAVLHPAVSSVGDTSVTLMAGVSFSTIFFGGNKDLAQSQISYSYNNQIWTADRNGFSPTQLTTNFVPTSGDRRSSWSTDGRIAFESYTSSGLEIMVMNADGTGQYVASNNPSDWQPAFQPNNARIAFVRYDTSLNPPRSQIYLMTPTGVSQTRLSDGTANDDEPAWSPDSTRIAFRRYNAVTTYHEIWIMNNNGSGAHLATTNLNGYEQGDPCWTPDGKQILFVIAGGQAAVGSIDVASSTGLQMFSSGDTSGLSNPTPSPDGKYIAYIKHASPNSQLWEAQYGGSNPHALISDPNFNVAFPQWSPFVKKTLVGSGGSMGTAASGFLLSLNAGAFSSFVTFIATTPGTATVTPQSGSGLVFLLKADHITALRYVNNVYSAFNAVLPGLGSSATSVLVTFNGTTGQLESALPFSKMAKVSTKNGNLGFSGNLLGVWTKNGLKQVSSDTSYVELDPKTGKVVKIR